MIDLNAQEESLATKSLSKTEFEKTMHMISFIAQELLAKTYIDREELDFLLNQAAEIKEEEMLEEHPDWDYETAYEAAQMFIISLEDDYYELVNYLGFNNVLEYLNNRNDWSIL